MISYQTLIPLQPIWFSFCSLAIFISFITLIICNDVNNVHFHLSKFPGQFHFIAIQSMQFHLGYSFCFRSFLLLLLVQTLCRYFALNHMIRLFIRSYCAELCGIVIVSEEDREQEFLFLFCCCCSLSEPIIE